ncbi:MAG: ribonuclease P protein component [Neomegalonema sp.]|nr:ribonuclease P protein component [Neomegalonema sp.]
MVGKSSRAVGLVAGRALPLEPAPVVCDRAEADTNSDKVSPLPVGRLKERREFLAAARAASAAAPGFVLQARKRSARDGERLSQKIGGSAASAPRVGFTASKKVGNAVARNRAKRRLRALADELAPLHGRPGWDYVLIARAEETATRSFAQMREELIRAFRRVHDPKARSGGGHRGKGDGKGKSKGKGVAKGSARGDGPGAADSARKVT